MAKGQKPHTESEVVTIADRLLKVIPRLQTPVHLIAFLAVVGIIILYLVKGLPTATIIFVIASILLIIIFVHGPSLLQDATTSVKLVFLLGCLVCFLATLGIGVYLAMASPPSRATWYNPGRMPLEELIRPVNAREGYNFSFTAQPPDRNAEPSIRQLQLRTPIVIERESFAEVFQELARLNRPCLRAEVSGSDIRLILDRTRGSFERDSESYDVCRTS